MWHHAPALEMAAWPPLPLAFVPQTSEDRGRAGDVALKKVAAWPRGTRGERMGAWNPVPPGLPLHPKRVGVPQAHASGFSVFSKRVFSTLC